MATLERLIKIGADKLIRKSAQTSEQEPNLAIAQLLLSAAILAKTSGMSESQFVKGCDLARAEMYDD